ncbi:hypothetical protein PTKU46_82790 [Paraburkholderia terrae]
MQQPVAVGWHDPVPVFCVILFPAPISNRVGDQRVERRGKQPLEKPQNYFERPAEEQYGAGFLEVNLFPLTRAAVVSPWSHGNKIVQTNGDTPTPPARAPAHENRP